MFNGTGTGARFTRATTNFANGWSGYTVTSWIKSNLTNSDQGWNHLTAPAGSDRNGTVRYDAAGSQGGATNTMKFGLLIGGQVEYNAESAQDVQSTGVQFVVGRWSSGNNLEIWVDGTLPTQSYADAPTGTIDGSTYTQMIIGAGAKEVVGGNFNGIVYEMRVYNRSLSQGEIETMYELRGVDGIYDGIQAWYRDSGIAVGATIPITADLIKDLSGSGLHLTASAADTTAPETVLRQRRRVS